MSRSTLSPLIKAQIEQLTAAGGDLISVRRSTDSSLPIIIPKEPLRSTVASSQNSSSYMSSFNETSFQMHHDLFDVSNAYLPTLPTTYQRLDNKAARDRISVKNKRQQQPIKHRLNSLRETDDDLFSSTSDDEPAAVVPQVESNIQQMLVSLSDLDATRQRLRVNARPRDLLVDDTFSITHINPTNTSSIQRSASCKRPQEINRTKYIDQSIFNIKNNRKTEEEDEEMEEYKNDSIVQDFGIKHSTPLRANPSVSSDEHIYDNSDAYKHLRTKPMNNNDSSIAAILKPRENPLLKPARLRPVTMVIPTNNDNQTTNEFERVFNQLKKHGSIRKLDQLKSPTNFEQSKEPVDSTFTFDNKKPIVEHVVPTYTINETPRVEKVIPTYTVTEPSTVHKIIPISTINESSTTHKVIPTHLVAEVPSVSRSIIRRKTVSGALAPANNKVASDDHKPVPSWIDIAKQKQSKFQNLYTEEHINEHSSPIESTKHVIVPSNLLPTKENSTEDHYYNRKLKLEPVGNTRRTSPTLTSSNTHDSIRTLRTNNSNHIKALIQLFDK